MTRQGRLITLGVLAIVGYVCLTPIAVLAALAQGYPSDLTAHPARLTVVFAAEMAVVAVLSYGGLVAVVECAYAAQRHVRRRADLDSSGRPEGTQASSGRR